MPEHIRQEPKVLVSTENLTEQEWLAYRRQGIHGDHNSKPTEEVQKFIDLWSRKVLPMALQAA